MEKEKHRDIYRTFVPSDWLLRAKETLRMNDPEGTRSFHMGQCQAPGYLFPLGEKLDRSPYPQLDPLYLKI